MTDAMIKKGASTAECPKPENPAFVIPKPLSDSKVAIVTSASMHHEDDDHDVREHVKRLFDRFDKDGLGINVKELGMIVKDIDPNQTDEAIQQLFEAADSDPAGRDEEGLIDFDEFFAAVQNPDLAAGSDLNFQALVLQKQFIDIRNAASSHMFVIVFLLCTFAFARCVCQQPVAP